MMLGKIRRVVDSFRGFGDFALTVPSLDGAFKPNNAIEEADTIVRWSGPDNVTVAGGTVFFSSGGALLKGSNSGEVTTVEEDTAPITAVAGAADGRLAVARSGGRIYVLQTDGKQRELTALAGKGDVTSMTFLDDGGLALTIGADGRPSDHWRRDLMEKGRTGSVWILDTRGNLRKLADKLAYPYGVVSDGKGNMIVSVSWESALICVGPDGDTKTVLAHLPGYPSRIIRTATGGYWLAIFAPRNQLVEFVLREKVFRQRMMDEIEPQYWICPQLAPAESPLEVMQEGTQRIGGKIKPWAPTLSYGLIARIGSDFLPQFSFHSRANGQRHGITSIAEKGASLLATTTGGNAIIKIPNEQVH